MKKFLQFALVAVLGLTLAACSGDGESSQPGDVTQAQPQSASDEPSDDAIKIEEIPYEVSPGVDNGTRRAMFSYTNNSDYTILRVELELLPKEGAEAEQISSAFDYLIESGMTEDEVRDGLMTCRDALPVAPGETSRETTLNFSGYYVNNVEQYELMEPDLMTIRYLHNGLIYEEYYDFRSGTYDLSSDVTETDLWGEGEICALVPRPEGELVVDVDESETRFSFETEGTMPDGFSTYVDACRDAGFTENVADTDTTYYADNAEGTYHIDLFYDDYSGSITAYVDLIDE